MWIPMICFQKISVQCNELAVELRIWIQVLICEIEINQPVWYSLGFMKSVYVLSALVERYGV